MGRSIAIHAWREYRARLVGVNPVGDIPAEYLVNTW